MILAGAFVLAALPFITHATPVPKSKESISIPLTKRAPISIDGVANLDGLRSQLANLESKYDHTMSMFKQNTGVPHALASVRALGRAAQRRRAKRASYSDPLTDSQDTLWYGSISIGTPAVTYTIDFDTGSSDLFVPSSSCSSCGQHTPYDPNASSTSSAVGSQFKLQYGDGSTTSGDQYKDTVAIGSLTATGQTLGSATQYSTSFATGPNDGLMGMGFPNLSSFPATPFFNTLKEQGALDAGVFAFKLASEGSVLNLGALDSSLYTGDINYNTVTEQAYWQVVLDAFNVGGQAANTNVPAIIDSGTTLIVGPSASVSSFYAAIPGAQDASSTIGEGFYTFPCANIPAISATFGGVSYTIAEDNFNLGQVEEGSDQCVGSVVSGNEGFYIFGDSFMRGVFTVFDFDNSRVGFATLA